MTKTKALLNPNKKIQKKSKQKGLPKSPKSEIFVSKHTTGQTIESKANFIPNIVNLTSHYTS